MKKMLKELGAVVMIATVCVTPVFAKNGDMYYNEQQGGWYKEEAIDGQARFKNLSTGELNEKVPMGKIYTYEFQAEGTERTVSVILKNGVAMIEVQALSEGLGVNCEEIGNNVEFFGYVTRKESPSLMPSSVLLSKKGNKYWAETSEVKKVDNMNGSWVENVTKEGVLKTSIQTINGKTYVPGREVIDMINQKETKITYNETTKTITFKQMRDWYKLNVLENTY